MPTHNSSQTRALVTLLADEDPKVLEMVWEHLLRIGPRSIPVLREACEAQDPRLRLRARYALGQIMQADIERQLQTLASTEDDHFDLEGALYVLARIEYPELKRTEIRWPLDEIAERVRPYLTRVRQPLGWIRAINRVLFEDMKFTGSFQDWHDLESTFLNRVLDRRLGTPVMLAAVYMLVGKRLDVPLVGVGLPNHFLVRYPAEGEEIFIDPFLGGKVLTRRECVQQYLRDYYPKEAYIQQTAGRDIAIRSLRHLVLVYSRQKDKPRLRQLGRYLEILQSRERTR